MPVVWNAETEAKLLAGLFKVCEIKVGAPQLKALAEIIGPECTPKAVQHRVAKFRTQAAAFAGGAKSVGKNDMEHNSPGAGNKRGRKRKTTGAIEAAEEPAEENMGEGEVCDDKEDDKMLLKRIKTEAEDGDDVF